MRCLNKLYEHGGECDVCHMRLVPYQPKARKLLGYTCPLRLSPVVFDKGGRCPYCTLQLKETYDGPPPPKSFKGPRSPWPELEGRTAVYFRPYTVRPFGVERLLRAAGRLSGRRLALRLPPREAARLKKGGTAMIVPPQGYAHPVLAEVESLGAGGRVVLLAARALPGIEWVLAEVRVVDPPSLAVPLAALCEGGSRSRVFVKRGEAFEARDVTVTARGENFASVAGIADGEVVAGSGTFWLEAQWRMDHP
jgi:hypothetical protein